MTDVHNAFSPLGEKDKFNIYQLIKVLKSIDNNQSSRETSLILNNVEKDLQQYLNSLITNDFVFSKEGLIELLQKPYKYLQNGIEIHTEIIYLGSDRKKELIALGYFLQAKLSTQDELSYIKNILHSYLTIIEQFRNPSSHQS